jgi:hypothetical protein
MKYVGRFTAERMQREQDHERNAPVALFEMLREEDGARELFDGLMLHYLKSFGRDRLDVWAKAAHAIVDLLAHPGLEINKRLPDVPPK